MTPITWLHLSDLHLRGTEGAVERKTFSEMLSDIRRQCEEQGIAPDVVFFTGDVAFSSHPNQYSLAMEWFDQILETCGLSGQRGQLFVVPGNHDVNRSEVYRAKYTRLFHETLANDLLAPSNPYEEINRFLSQSPDRELALAKFHNYARFTEEYFSDDEMKFDHNRYYFVRAIEKDGYTIAVLGLNSAWLSFRDREQGQLILGERQVCDALEEAHNNWPSARLHVALVHHPLYWLVEKDIHRVQQHFPYKCDLLLRGHLHCPSLSVQRTPDSQLLVFSAGASLKAHYHAYNLVQLDLDTGKGVATVRLQHPDIGGRWGSDNFTYSNTREGKMEFSLPLDSVATATEE